MATIQFSHISKSFSAGTDAVKNFNLNVSDGEFLVIVGSSGCDKSTVLRMVAGLEEITSGELKINGKVVNELEPKNRNVAMVFQNYALFPNLTVEENMEFALKMQRVPKKERRQKVADMAKILGIEELLKHKAKGLSGGQCQRIAIGRALICQPQVFLMDEPLSNLDASMRSELRTEIAQLQKELGITTLYVTHDLTEAMTLASRVVVMNQGEIQQGRHSTEHLLQTTKHLCRTLYRNLYHESSSRKNHTEWRRPSTADWKHPNHPARLEKTDSAGKRLCG